MATLIRVLSKLTFASSYLFKSIKNAFTKTDLEKTNETKFKNIKFKHQFKMLYFYSIPESVLITLRRRLLFVFAIIIAIFSLFWSML